MTSRFAVAGHLETIADAVNGVNPARVARIIANLGAQVLHMTVNRALVALEVIAEHLLDELHARVHAARIARQSREQLELAGREIDLLVVDEDFVAVEIDGEAAKVERGRARRARVAKRV